ncbi:MAG: hypothetical protein AVDCRST_MAG19-3293, partial [uncultured Thermomicrobiales bacterium]
ALPQTPAARPLPRPRPHPLRRLRPLALHPGALRRLHRLARDVPEQALRRAGELPQARRRRRLLERARAQCLDAPRAAGHRPQHRPRPRGPHAAGDPCRRIGVPRRLLLPPGDVRRRHRRPLELRLPPQHRSPQRRARQPRPRRPEADLARRSGPRPLGDLRRRRLGRGRLLRRLLRRRHAVDPGRSLRGRPARRGEPVAGVLGHHLAAAARPPPGRPHLRRSRRARSLRPRPGDGRGGRPQPRRRRRRPVHGRRRLRTEPVRLRDRDRRRPARPQPDALVRDVPPHPAGTARVL